MSGGAEGTRTPDLYSAIVALSQLSYSPFSPTQRLYRRGGVCQASPAGYNGVHGR